MSPVVIENPVLNSPFLEPNRHFRFSEDGITNEVEESRRISSYFIPIPPPKKKGGQLTLPGDWNAERIQENVFINRVRERVAIWRRGNYPGITRISRDLLSHWTRPDREKRLFFCQIEALETLIYLTEAAKKYGDTWIENTLREQNDHANPSLERIAMKMATGSGKTVVMAMLIAWHALNKFANTKDARFSDAFLVVTPGITIRDRLRVLLPNDPNNYYAQWDLVSPDQITALQQVKILITNFHAFTRRDRFDAASLTKKVLVGRDGDLERLKETPDGMVRRVCRSFGSKKNIVVINDEAHHCYRENPDKKEQKLDADERAEVKHNAEAARVWISGLEAVKAKIGLRAIYDLSATPFFLRGSGYPEGTLFPWVVSDFSLIDAIESGIVKVPRVPVSDDQMIGESPTYRDLWVRIRDHLPRKGRKVEDISGEPKLPKELEGALRSLYGNYEKAYRRWEQLGNGSPPVFIVVCNNTNVSKLIFDWIAGWEKPLGTVGDTVVVPGNLEIFSNEQNQGWCDRPQTLLIDSAQLESGEAMDPAFKKIAAVEINEFKQEYRIRYPGRDPEALTDEDLLREVMNTVGKPGRLGEKVKCVVSVSMLTEGWDANTVTHILGVRAFGTQLLCEQVVGRGLRRISYEPNPDGMFEPEYAEVYGVPFSFIPTAGTKPDPTPPKPIHRVRAMEDRASLEMNFPRLVGYRFDLPVERFDVSFGEGSNLVLSTREMPTRVELDPIAGESTIHDLADLKSRRLQEVAFVVTKRTLDKYFRDDDGNDRPWLFPQLLAITKSWLNKCVVCKDKTFKQMLLITEYAHDAADKIYHSIVLAAQGEKRIMPILRPYDPQGSTNYVAFDTTKPVYTTDPEKCHINYVTADSNWEHKMAQVLETMPEVICYAKNQGLGFFIPYTFEGEPANYLPDYLAYVHDDREGVINFIIEVSGEAKKDKAAKVATARNLWVPAVNNHGGYGQWAFLEVTDPWDAESAIRGKLDEISKQVRSIA